MLNPSQQEAVDQEGNTLVVAGPGTGKTRVIIAKIQKILADRADHRVCAVTFTRDAANELTQRVQQELEASHSPRKARELMSLCRIGTFHSLAIQQQREAGLLGKLATPQEQYAFLTQAMRTANLPNDAKSYEEALKAIETAKCSMEPEPERLLDPVVQAYQRILARNRTRDLYDVIRDAVTGMRAGTVRPIHAAGLTCTHLLVDEYQDCDEVQYAWIMELVRRDVQTMVVGDDDQTIFEWRRALGYQGMTLFKEEARAKEVVLGHNYRCRSEILSSADNLIRNNRGKRIEKRLVAAKGPGGSVQVVQGPDAETQAAILIEFIEPDLVPAPQNSRFTYTVQQGQWAIIARNHALLNTVEAELTAKGIEFQRSGAGIWKLPFLAMFLGILKALQLGTSAAIDNALDYMGVASESLDRLHQLTGGKFSTYLDGKLASYEGISERDAAFLEHFSYRTAGWRDSLKQGAYDHVISGVASLIREEVLEADKSNKIRLLEMAADIVMGMGRRTVRSGNGERPLTLSERAERLERPRERTGTGVVLHTMHSCKGLEFDKVGIYDVSTGTIPDPERLDDLNDRRLLYVAMTRAREQLYMSYSVKERSRFLDEIGVK